MLLLRDTCSFIIRRDSFYCRTANNWKIDFPVNYDDNTNMMMMMMITMLIITMINIYHLSSMGLPIHYD